MKNFIKKLLILIGLISIAPFFSYAATVTCTPGYANDLVGKTVNASASVQNGNGTAYDFTWGGDDSIGASGQTITHSYSQPGIMTINVTASSTDSSDFLTGSCSVGIYTDATLPDLTASCIPNVNSAVIGQNITWYQTINGPLGPYTTTWSGEELSGTFSSSPSLAYTSSGDKTAKMVSFVSRYGAETPIHNGKVSNIACTTLVNIVSEQIHNPPPLIVTGSCGASPSSVNLGNSVTWNSNLNISGGVAPYRISWTDNDGEIGTGSSTTKVYSTIGTKMAYLTVEDSAEQSNDVDCGSLSVNNSNNGLGNYSSGGGTNNNLTTTVATSTSAASTSTATSTILRTAISTSPTSTTTQNINNSDNNNGLENGNPGSNNNYPIFNNFIFNTDQNPATYSDDVANLQNRLTIEGYYNGLIGGFFGPATEQALKNYQGENGLNVTGILDAETRDSLNGINSQNLTATPTGQAGTEVPSRISGLTATVLEAIGFAVNFLKTNMIATLYFLIVLLCISQILLWLKIVSKNKE